MKRKENKQPRHLLKQCCQPLVVPAHLGQNVGQYGGMKRIRIIIDGRPASSPAFTCIPPAETTAQALHFISTVLGQHLESGESATVMVRDATTRFEDAARLSFPLSLFDDRGVGEILPAIGGYLASHDVFDLIVACD